MIIHILTHRNKNCNTLKRFFAISAFCTFSTRFFMHIVQKNYLILQIFQRVMHLFRILFWILIIFGFDEMYVAILSIVSIFLHECGHIIPMCLLKGLSLPQGKLNGFRIKTLNLSYKAKIVVAACGPAVNIALALFFFPISRTCRYLQILVAINALTGISNLIPTSGSDGYNILESLGLHFELKDAFFYILRILSVFINIVFLFLFLYFILNAGEGYWLCGLFMFSTIKDLENTKKHYFEAFKSKNEI